MTLLEHTDGRGALRIGSLVPFTHCNPEPDVERLKPPGATLHSARLGGYDIDAILGFEQMAGLGAAPLDEPMRLISGVRPNAVLYGCTSAAGSTTTDKPICSLQRSSSWARPLITQMPRQSYSLAPICVPSKWSRHSRPRLANQS